MYFTVEIIIFLLPTQLMETCPYKYNIVIDLQNGSSYIVIEFHLHSFLRLCKDVKFGANNHVYFISQDQMGNESRSKKKETRAI